jgi:cell division protease FtsH
MFDEDEDKPAKEKKRDAQRESGGGGQGQGDPDNGDDRNNPKGVGFKSSRLLFFLIFIGIFIAVAAGTSSQINTKEEALDSWTAFLDKVDKKQIKSVKITGREVTGEYSDSTPVGSTFGTFRVTAPDPITDVDKSRLYANTAMKVRFDPPSAWPSMLMFWIPWLLLFALVYFLVFRQLRGPGGPGGVLSFGKSRAKLITKDRTKKTFKDVAGVDEAKEEVQELVGFLKNPKKFQRLGGRIPKGVLMIGPPGTGKTLLAKAIAGEADVPFYSISGSDFVEMFVGVGASRVRDLFEQARENSPCIIFLDEIDAVGRRRGTGLGGGHDEREQTLNEILVQMDGMESDDKIIVMASTNRPDVLDPALLRPGRFDRHVYVDLPDVKGREQILRVHSQKVKLASTVDLNVLAKATPTFSGADLENLINEAALIAVTKEKDAIDNLDLEEARDKVVFGREKKSRVMDESDLWTTAYHEAGHALLAHLLPKVDKPHKVTIIPRGRALGVTYTLPSKDSYNKTRKELLEQIMMMFGGRIAEEMFVGDVSTGDANDIERATGLIRRMVTEWGMSDKLGPIKYQGDEETLFLGREVNKTQNCSSETAVVIDQEIRRMVDEQYAAAEKILRAHSADIELIAKALMEYETITGEEMTYLLKERKFPEDRKPVKQITPRMLPKPEAEPVKTPKPKEDLGGGLGGAMPVPNPA